MNNKIKILKISKKLKIINKWIINKMNLYFHNVI